MKSVALVLTGLVAGAVAGAFLPRVLADGARPAAPALTAGGAVKWQQFCEPASSIAEGSSMAGARGAEGWELVGFFGGALCFKRPVSAATMQRPAGESGPLGPAEPPAPRSPSWPGY